MNTGSSSFRSICRHQRGGSDETCLPFPVPSSSSHLVDDVGEDVDHVGARELGLLTPQQRERIFEEIHGVCDEFHEEPKIVAKRLAQMEQEIHKIRDKSAYIKAFFLAPSRVKDRTFRMIFLRATLFDPTLAAKCIVKHFEYKAELFGIEKVAKTITLDDLDVDDRRALEAGALQYLPYTDRAGRSIVFTTLYDSNFKTWQSEIRVAWYKAMVALEENEQLQKRGIVTVCYAMDCTESKHISCHEILSKFYMLRDGLPLRRNAMHFCYNSAAMRSVMALFRTIAGPQYRLRFRGHCGSYQEIQYQLRTFGIDPRMFPLDDKGILLETSIKSYIEERMKNEAKKRELEAASKVIYAPTPQDVLLGRGRPFQEHSGNLQLVRLLDEVWDDYMAANRLQKTSISWELVKKVHIKQGGRFLEKDDASDTWREVSNEIAREKCSSGFRSMKKALVRGDDSSLMMGMDMLIDSPKRAKHPKHDFTNM